MGEPHDSADQPGEDNGQHQAPLHPSDDQDGTNLPGSSLGLGADRPRSPADAGPDDDEYERL